MSDEGKMAEPQAASTTAPPEGKNGVDITAAASGVNSGGSGAAQGSEEAEGEIDEDESCPKVSGKSKMDSALSAPRTPYAKPQGEKTHDNILSYVFVEIVLSDMSLLYCYYGII